jgi:hypothetical protein
MMYCCLGFWAGFWSGILGGFLLCLGLCRFFFLVSLPFMFLCHFVYFLYAQGRLRFL